MPALRRAPSPFRIVTGASAGAINGSVLAALSGDFGEATRTLARLWARLRVEDVFRPDLLSLGRSLGRFLVDMTLGGLVGGGRVAGLLDASPLCALLGRTLPIEGIGEAIRADHLYALAITATSYHSGRSFTFIQGRPGHPLWLKSRRVTLSVPITVDHVCASAAIPLVFSPVRLRCEGRDMWFGDGGLRLVTPFSPAIRLGATHVLGIGVRSAAAAAALSRAEELADEVTAQLECPPLAQVCGVFLNAIFLDHLDADLDHLRRMNELIEATAHADAVPLGGRPVSEPMRTVKPLVLSPSTDLAIVAKAFSHRMPRVIRYLMEGLGTPDAQSADLMSYLLFDASYTRALLDIGYEDAGRALDVLEAFIAEAPVPATPQRAA
jgi:NTE family protein